MEDFEKLHFFMKLLDLDLDFFFSLDLVRELFRVRILYQIIFTRTDPEKN